MEINRLLTGLQTYEQSRIDKQKNKSGSGSAKAGSTSDRVTLSQGAALYKSGLEQAMSADEVRSEKIEELRTSIQEGTYQPDSRRIAEKMIREDLESWL